MQSRALASPGSPGGGKRLLAPGTKCRVGASAVPGGRVIRGSLRLLPEGAPPSVIPDGIMSVLRDLMSKRSNDER